MITIIVEEEEGEEEEEKEEDPHKQFPKGGVIPKSAFTVTPLECKYTFFYKINNIILNKTNNSETK